MKPILYAFSSVAGAGVEVAFICKDCHGKLQNTSGYHEMLVGTALGLYGVEGETVVTCDTCLTEMSPKEVEKPKTDKPKNLKKVRIIGVDIRDKTLDQLARIVERKVLALKRAGYEVQVHDRAEGVVLMGRLPPDPKDFPLVGLAIPGMPSPPPPMKMQTSAPPIMKQPRVSSRLIAVLSQLDAADVSAKDAVDKALKDDDLLPTTRLDIADDLDAAATAHDADGPHIEHNGQPCKFSIFLRAAAKHLREVAEGAVS